MLKRALYSALILGVMTPALAKVKAVDGYVRLQPPGITTTAAFMVLRNEGDKQVNLVAATSAEANRAEMHTMIHRNGVMNMHQVERIEIPAKGEVVLQPGSFHIMLFEIGTLSEKKPLPLTLTMDDGQQLELSLPVKPIKAIGEMQNMKH